MQGSCDGADGGQKKGRTEEAGSGNGKHDRARNCKRGIVINLSMLLSLVCCVNLIKLIVCFSGAVETLISMDMVIAWITRLGHGPLVYVRAAVYL